MEVWWHEATYLLIDPEVRFVNVRLSPIARHVVVFTSWKRILKKKMVLLQCYRLQEARQLLPLSRSEAGQVSNVLMSLFLSWWLRATHRPMEFKPRLVLKDLHATFTFEFVTLFLYAEDDVGFMRGNQRQRNSLFCVQSLRTIDRHELWNEDAALLATVHEIPWRLLLWNFRNPLCYDASINFINTIHYHRYCLELPSHSRPIVQHLGWNNTVQSYLSISL